MKIKDRLVLIIICAIVVCLYVVIGSYKNITNEANRLYKVYLDSEVIGVIDSKEQLYQLIDEKQQVIKDKYNVNAVYPPNSLQVLETYTYETTISNIEDVYNKIEQLQDFTIEGYEIKFSKTDEHDEFSIYVLDKDVFNEALKKYILVFVGEEEYNEYINNTQKSLEDSGRIYENMGFLEKISIREKRISTNSKIYENSEELVSDLLFGFNHENKSYTVKVGDTIESVSAANVLNVEEFRIANPQFSRNNSMLKVGEVVNVTLINPEIAFVYTVSEIKEVEKDFENTIVRDNNKDSSYSEITTPGVKGLSLQVSNYSVTNGEPSSETKIIEERVIREVINQVTTKGKKVASGGGVWGRETYVDTGSGWRWPTQSPYSVTSEFAPRWGRHHDGIDISGAGFGSNIYAVNDGVVTHVTSGCADIGSYGNGCGGGFGNYIVINHGNNIYTVYAHITNTIHVSVGQTVSRGTLIGHMGSSGSSTGYHLHFGLSIGEPRGGGIYRNPRELYR